MPLSREQRALLFASLEAADAAIAHLAPTRQALHGCWLVSRSARSKEHESWHEDKTLLHGFVRSHVRFQPRRRDACFLARARAAVGCKRWLGALQRNL
jgi:hypothetical protein